MISIIYAIIEFLCGGAFLLLLVEWIRVERKERARTKRLEIQTRELFKRELF